MVQQVFVTSSRSGRAEVAPDRAGAGKTIPAPTTARCSCDCSSDRPTTPNLGGRQSGDQREQADPEEADAEPELRAGTTRG
jgi:hypothetical protein